jgi:diamine N-acetyltransferase
MTRQACSRSRQTPRGASASSTALTEPRKHFVATNAISLAQAHFNKHAWFHAIYAGKAPVGFMMIVDDDETPKYFLWRFMITEPYQGRGYGSQAIQRLAEYVPGPAGRGRAPGELRRGRGQSQGILSETGIRAPGE